MVQQQVLWKKPPDGSIMLNTDGMLQALRAGYGGVFRDVDGRVILLYNGGSKSRSQYDASLEKEFSIADVELDQISKCLAYLNMRRISSLEELPDWIRKRQNLQILVIIECSNLKRLPSCITTLQNLVVLDVDNCPLQCLPRGLGRPTKLQVLSGFKLPSPSKDGTLATC
ncbi:hypothetical protein IFM89_010546 [Coptis chinensis]|uniref:Disease resistance R13L4/SHOC-2-like LRR domain-containing protein n=1 Tax=Coptis chinensis TaxID=261450 RepID=A0A835IVD3_9MAGN|nr:hypothetical protein IFM89_010546 [Coptis chinensis]